MAHPPQLPTSILYTLRYALALALLLLLAACTPMASTPAAPASTTPPAAAGATAPATDPSPAVAGTPLATPPAAAAPAGTPAANCQQAAQAVAQTEGPYFKAGAPQRASLLEPGMAGTRLVLMGQVMTPTCVPLAGAKLDFWQADDAGGYDNAGYKLRGYVVADEQGRYRVETIVPGLYPGRTRHIHVKVQPPGQPALTTQLYFPDEPRNQSDGIFHRDLVIKMSDAAGGKSGVFDFVLRGG